MEVDPVLRASQLAELIAELLQRVAATSPPGTVRHDSRYAEALAQTLRDHLDSMLRARRSEAA
jgi:hypothetical protein